MPLTRHLYKEDEVVAAMQWSILRGKCVEAAFWCQELLDSDMADALIGAMRHIWLFGYGIGAIPWYKAFVAFAEAEALDAEEALKLVVALCRIGIAGGRDTSFLAMVGSQAPPDRVGICITPKGLQGADAFFAAAIHQGRAITAWRAHTTILEGTLGQVATWKHGQIGTEVVGLIAREYPALAVAALCLERDTLEQRWNKELPGMLREVEEAVAEWEACIGRRSRRKFSIPHDCLYLITERGRSCVYKSTEPQLRGSLERPGKLWGSVFWDEVAEEVGGWEAVRNDYEVREAFYDEHFRDDIPDEWSKADREKSHGIGALQRDTECSVERFLVKWFGHIPSAVVWNQTKNAIATRLGDSWEEWAAPTVCAFELDLRRIGSRTFVVA